MGRSTEKKLEDKELQSVIRSKGESFSKLDSSSVSISIEPSSTLISAYIEDTCDDVSIETMFGTRYGSLLARRIFSSTSMALITWMMVYIDLLVTSLKHESLSSKRADAEHFNLFCYLLRLADGARRLGVLNVRWEECGTHDVVRGELGPPVSTAIPKSESLRPGVMDPGHEFFTGTKEPRWNWCQNGNARRNLPPTARDGV